MLPKPWPGIVKDAHSSLSLAVKTLDYLKISVEIGCQLMDFTKTIGVVPNPALNPVLAVKQTLVCRHQKNATVMQNEMNGLKMVAILIQQLYSLLLMWCLEMLSAQEKQTTLLALSSVQVMSESINKAGFI